MNILKSKYYPKFMYFALIIISLLIVFNIANIMQDAKIKTEHKGVSGFATEIDRTNDSLINHTNQYQNQQQNNSTSENNEMYSSKSYLIYYVLLIGIIAGIFITFYVLKSTVVKNIELEEKEREF